MPSSIVAAYTFLAAAYAESAVFAFAVNMIASAVISKAFFSPSGYDPSGQSQNPGSRQQVAPATDNKLPVVYGSAWLGGTITDLTITTDNQDMYFVLSLCEVTNSNTGSTPDTISFGEIYYGGKKVTFKADGYTVASLTDESTGIVDTSVADKIQIFLYSNGSYNPTNSTQSAISVLSNTNLAYQWDTTKLMSNCAFAIVHLTYNRDANVTNLQQTKFNVINSRNATGDCFYDYLTNTRYGCAIDPSQVNTTSLAALTTYSNQTMTYTTYSGGTATQTRFRFDGVLDTQRTCMQNLQDMASCCDCLLTYNQITAQWGVVVQQPTYTVAMDLNDSNMVSALQVTPIDLAGSYNVIECKFPDKSSQDAFNSATFDLATVAPSLLYPNEPVNKMSISLPLVNDNVRAQYLANRMLKAGREDLQLQVNVNFVGIQLEAGDIVTVTNSNYGWVAKPFRVNKVIETFADDGSITARLTLSEFNSTVYDDVSITQFTPAPNTGLPDPNSFGTIPAPVITTQYPTNTNPLFLVNVTSSSNGIVQYAEVWYSAYSSPTTSQLIFAGTTAINSDGSPYNPSSSMGSVSLSNIPSGNWYFFTRMVNSIATSNYSPPSAVLQWRPSTFQYTDQYLAVVYGDDIVGTNLSLSPSGKYYYGLRNQANQTVSTTASDYTWYLADPAFGSANYLCYSNRTGRKFSFDTGLANYAAGTAAFVPTQANIFDPSIWSALPNGVNTIDLDVRTGQLIETGTTTVGTGEIAITNNPDGKIVASLAKLLDFGTGITQYTGSATTLTIDQYGRVLGFVSPDNFYFTIDNFTATSGQTVFTPTARAVGYITGQDLVFENGVLLDTADYTENSTTVTLNTGAVTGSSITILSFRAVSSANYYEALNINYSSGTSTVTYTNLPYQTINNGDIITFANTGTPTQYTVSSVNYTTKQITFTTSVSGVTAGTPMYRYRSATSSYPVFSRYTTTLSSASSYTPTEWAFNSSFELIFVNGSIMADQDYDLVSGALTNFPSITSGLVTVIQFAPNNLGTPTGGMANIAINTTIGQTVYNLSFVASAFDLYQNGLLLVQGTDYTTSTTNYTLTNSPTTTANILVQQTFARTGAA